MRTSQKAAVSADRPSPGSGKKGLGLTDDGWQPVPSHQPCTSYMQLTES